MTSYSTNSYLLISRDYKNLPNKILRLFCLVIKITLSLGQHCEPIVSSKTGYALIGREYRSFPTKDYPTCMMACHEDVKCMSVNFHLVTKTCDLNTQTKESRPLCYTKRQNSIYSTNMAFRTPEPGPPKGSQELPAKSCLDVLSCGDSNDTGVYWIDPARTGIPMQAYCDMTTDGGGWTTIRKTILESASQPPPPTRVLTYQVISLYERKDNWIIPTTDAMLDIQKKMGFHQIHFYCHKKSVGRIVSIMTKKNTAGQAVVKYFTTPGLATYFPDACGSFDRLPEDTSFLALNCSKWGTAKPEYISGLLFNKWGYRSFHGPARLGTLPFQMNIPPKYFYGSAFRKVVGQQGYCDDSFPSPNPYSVNDTWVISVR